MSGSPGGGIVGSLPNVCSDRRPTRVLGIDPGLTRCGLGVLEVAGPRRLQLVAVGVARTPTDAEIGDRLALLERQLEDWIAEHQPEFVAIERYFSHDNVSTVMGTAQASAVALLVAARHRLPVGLHTPSEVKAAVTGDGRADKQAVAAMVVRVLGLTAAPKPADAADALALAICHAWRGTAASRLAAAAARAPRSRIPTAVPPGAPRARRLPAATPSVGSGVAGGSSTPTTARVVPGVRRGPRPASSDGSSR